MKTTTESIRGEQIWTSIHDSVYGLVWQDVCNQVTDHISLRVYNETENHVKSLIQEEIYESDRNLKKTYEIKRNN